MNLLKRTYKLLLGIILCLIIFQIENTKMFFGFLINQIYPCREEPLNSFPCYSNYDFYLMFLVLLIGLILLGILIFRLLYRKNS